MASMTIAMLLKEAQLRLAPVSKTPQLDAMVLLGFVLKVDRLQLILMQEHTVGVVEQTRFRELIEKRFQGIPLAYLLGYKEFWSLRLKVTPDTLIPRPETELLVETILGYFSENRVLRLLELGTGTGAIALALASERPKWEISAVDLSQAALGVAKENAKSNHLKSVCFMQSDWFSNVINRQFDVIVSNPPYLAPDDPHLVDEIRYEPRQALVAKEEGLADLRHIILNSPKYLSSQGWLFLEHGYEQAAAVRGFFGEAAYQQITTICDLAGHERVTLAQVP